MLKKQKNITDLYRKMLLQNSHCQIITISEIMAEKENKSQRHLFIDIRQNHEIARGIIPSSMTLIHFEIEFLTNPNKFSDFRLIFICENGMKSQIYVQKLIKSNKKFLNENKVSALSGGIRAYKSIFPLVNPINFKILEKEYDDLNEKYSFFTETLEILKMRFFQKAISVETSGFSEYLSVFVVTLFIFIVFYGYAIYFERTFLGLS